MGALTETWRGGGASLAWLAGYPFVTARIALTPHDKLQARDRISAHFTRFLRACRVSVKLDGPAPPPGAGCVICYNESSFVDVAAFSVTMWRYVDRAAAADLYALIPFVRGATRKADIELVPRGKRQVVDEMLARMVDRVRAGERLAWGGEGRLVGIDGIGRFKVGASLIAIRAQAPVVPVVFHGGHDVMPLGSIRARPGTVRIRFGDPVPTTGLTDADARNFADALQARFAQIYQDLKKAALHAS